MEVVLLVDIGSTNTKMTAVDLEKEAVVGRSYVASTVQTDMSLGLKEAYSRLLAQMGVDRLNVVRKLACSSAAGGLRIVVSGLVPDLTTESVKRAAFGAGGKIVGTYSYKLTRGELREIEQTAPDMILLAGGVDGGNEEVILHNARMLARSGLSCYMVVAGNKVVSEDAASYIRDSDKSVRVIENVLPELGRLNIEPCRGAIREIFMENIIYGKGFDRAQTFLDTVLMPTPLAVLKGGLLLARGTAAEEGIGDLIVLDIGGATVNVISMCPGSPSQAGVIPRGLPELYDKRTVEGNLGIRYNAYHILELVGREQLLADMSVWPDVPMKQVDLEAATKHLAAHVDSIPQSREEYLLDIGLARAAARVAMERHAGYIETEYAPAGTVLIQRGKDLTGVKQVISTGGVLTYGKEPLWILEALKWSEKNPASLKPRSPTFYSDKRYILYAMGLLSEMAPDVALRIAKKNLEQIGSGAS